LDLEEDGNKPRRITKQEAQTFADQIGAYFYETRLDFKIFKSIAIIFVFFFFS